MRENRAGMVLRAVRRRRGLTQAKLAEQAGVCQQSVSSLECGHADRATLGQIRAVAAPLGITVDLVLRWKGPELETLVDARHSRIVKQVLARLRPGWEVVVEYGFNDYGDRGSVDVVGWHTQSQALLLVEVKSELDSLESVLRSMDVKVRVVPGAIARERGWRAKSVGSVLVLPDESTARRAVSRMSAIFDVALPGRTVEARRWLRRPAGPLRAIWFLADTPHRRAVRNPGSAGRVFPPKGGPIHAHDEAEMVLAMAAAHPGAAEPASNTPTRRN